MSWWTGLPAKLRLSNSGPPRRRGPRGFTLLEVLVAFMILAVALAALMQSFSAGLRSSSTADTYSQAAMLAKSKLAEFSVPDTLEEGEYSGTFDNGFEWRAVVAPYRDDTFKEDDNRRLLAYSVTVTVDWDDAAEGQAVTLETLRLLSRLDSRNRRRE